MWGWVKIRSWHIILTPTRAFDTYVTLCERRAHGDRVDIFPAGDKTCETCMRKEARLRALDVDVP